MQYINPFDLLGIKIESLSDVNNYSINKSKRQLIADIELSDTNSIIHDGIELNKGDCIKIIEELDDKDSKEFHFFIYRNLALKRFLTSGDINFFENFKTESIYNLPEFVDFISPFFSQQYDKAFFDNFKKPNQNTLIKFLANKPIVNDLYFENCYKSTYLYIKEIDNEIKKTIIEISTGNSPFINKKFAGLDELIVEKVNIELLNLLPSYFQVLRNQLAMSIRNLARDINNKPFEFFEPAFKIIEIAYNISIDSLTKQTISKGYFIIKKNYEEEVAKQEATQRENENRQIINKWTEKENQIKNITKEIIDGNSKFISANFLSLDILILQIAQPNDLNFLTKNFQGLRNRIAENIRNLAKTVNNEPYHNYKVALDIIEIARSLIVEQKLSEDIDKTHQIIQTNLKKQIAQNTPLNTNTLLNDIRENVIKKWNEKISLIEKINTEIINGSSTFIKTDFLSLDILIIQIAEVSKLNSFAGTNYYSLHRSLAKKIMLLAITINSKPHENHRIALDIITIANSIKYTGPIKDEILSLINKIETSLANEINKQKEDIKQKNISNSEKETTDDNKATKIRSSIKFNRNIIKSLLNRYTKFNIAIIILCGIFIWAFFNKIVLIITLTLFLASIIFEIYEIFKTPIHQRKYRLTESVILSSVCITGFFIHEFGWLFIIYNLLFLLHLLYCRLYNLKNDEYIKNKRKIEIGTISVVIISIIWINELTQTNNLDIRKPTYSTAKKPDIYSDRILVPTTNSKNNKAHNLYERLTAINSTKDQSKQIELGTEDEFTNDVSNDTYDIIIERWGNIGITKQEFYDAFKVKKEGNSKSARKSEYIYPSMSNGNIKGCSNIKSQYNKNLNNRLVISCGSNADVAVKMIDYSTDKSIRYVYIRKNTTYTIRNIPEGRYYLKIAYGDYWAIKQGESVCEGRFTVHTVYEKGKDILNYYLRYDSEGGYQIPSYSLSLNVIFQDNDHQMNKFSTNNISEKEFYNE